MVRVKKLNAMLAAVARECIPENLVVGYLKSIFEQTDGDSGIDYYAKLEDAISGYLDRLATIGVFQRNPLDADYKLRMLSAWNALSDNLENTHEHRYWASSIIADHVISGLWHQVSLTRSKNENVYDYTAFIEDLSSGTFENFAPERDSCQETGIRVAHFIKGWKINPCSWTREAGFVPLISPTTPDEVKHATITFKTGKLIYADMIRLRPFMDYLNKIPDDDGAVPDNDLSSSAGVAKRTAIHAKQNIVHVYVGNSSPNIYSGEGKLTFGYHDKSDSQCQLGEFKDTGKNVCTDLWWVTLVDEADLLEILSISLSADEAKSAIDDFLSENEDGVGRLTVEPGEHHLYFHGDNYRIMNKFTTDDVDFGGLEHMFLLSKTEVLFTPKLEQKKLSPRP